MGYLYITKVIPALIILLHRLSDLFITFYQEIKYVLEYLLSEL